MNVLVLCPHTDDGEIYCGGSIARFVAEGASVSYVAFSIAPVPPPLAFLPSTVKAEVRQATALLGIKQGNLFLFDYEARELPAHRQAILDDLLKLKKDLKPDLVLLPSSYDTHQDHQVIAQEGFRAFKDVSMIGYEVSRNNLNFSANVFIALTEEQFRLKLRATKCYRSQMSRPSCSISYIRALAQLRGGQIGVKYAEAFESIRWIMRQNR